MSPAEDARLLLQIVGRHLRSLGLTLDGAFPDEDWGFTAQQALEKLLKVLIVLADRRPPAAMSWSCSVIWPGWNCLPTYWPCRPLRWRPATRRAHFRCRRRASNYWTRSKHC